MLLYEVVAQVNSTLPEFESTCSNNGGAPQPWNKHMYTWRRAIGAAHEACAFAMMGLRGMSRMHDSICSAEQPSPKIVSCLPSLSGSKQPAMETYILIQGGHALDRYLLCLQCLAAASGCDKCLTWPLRLKDQWTNPNPFALTLVFIWHQVARLNLWL